MGPLQVTGEERPKHLTATSKAESDHKRWVKYDNHQRLMKMEQKAAKARKKRKAKKKNRKK